MTNQEIREIFKQQEVALKELKKLYQHGVISYEMYEDGCAQINKKAAEMIFA